MIGYLRISVILTLLVNGSNFISNLMRHMILHDTRSVEENVFIPACRCNHFTVFFGNDAHIILHRTKWERHVHHKFSYQSSVRTTDSSHCPPVVMLCKRNIFVRPNVGKRA